MLSRERDTGARLDALVSGVDWARMGTSGSGEVVRRDSIDHEKALHPAI